MKKLFFILAIGFLLSCSDSATLEFHTDQSGDFKVVLYRLELNAAIPVDTFRQAGDSTFTITPPQWENGLYRVAKLSNGKTIGAFNIIYDEKADREKWRVYEQGDSLYSDGLPETERLFKINRLTVGCDLRYQKLMLELGFNKKEGHEEAAEAVRELLDNHFVKCTTGLKTIIEEDPNSISSLYALNYLDPEKDSTLIYSVYCKTMVRYPDLYLHQEIATNLGLDIQCP